MEEDLVTYKELFSQRTFGISKLFQKNHFDVCSKLVLKNSSDFYG
jgi:hypothetical protein